MGEFRAGDRWREVATGRVIVLLGPGPNSWWFRYEADPRRTPWHCDICDFDLWGRFVPLS